MKRIIFAVAICLVAVAAFGADSVWYEQFHVFSQTTGTTGAVTGSDFVFHHPVKDLGVDVNSSVTTTVQVRIDGHQGWVGHSASGLASATTCTVFPCRFVITGVPVKVIRPVVTSPSSTLPTVTVDVTGMQ